ncbi:right-handed parallel beta-helix repeat-containing protein [Asticcacaulis sp. AC460]|uniref:right-handed parallel beta-helix repeat-containing protein n=1 Tax=Asticcacaulis sp. AC460 TaxID=1282360 RepID=UPI0004020E7B|nr:right-handed parallel beta-helix repeat-containing protein [Asticcacaulis sp. AC460]
MRKNSETSPSGRVRAGLGLGVVAAVAMALAPVSVPQAAAGEGNYENSRAAGVSGYMKPCFGMLLDAQLRTCGPRHYKGGSRYGYHGRGQADATVDCDRANPRYVEEVVGRIRSGGVLYLKAKNRSCVASLDIKKSITIVGQGYGPQQIPVLVAPPGESAIRISSGADQVILKDMYISAPRSGGMPGIEGSNTELTIQNTQIRYQGDDAAVHLSGGRLNLTENSHIIAKTRSVALAVNNASLFAENSQIATTAGGIYAVLDGDSQMQGVSVQQLADWHGFERGEGATGIEIRLDSGGSILSMNDMKVLYFSQGVSIEGSGEALLSHTLIARADHGIVLGLNRARVIENTIIASEIGIDVQDGEAFVGRNQIANIRTAGILASATGEIRAVDNQIDPNGEGCPTLKWGTVDPSQRVCTPWYRGSEFDVPGDANDQYMFDEFWPRMATVAMTDGAATTAPGGPVPYNDLKSKP